MSLPPPAVRSALIGLAVVTAAVGAGVWLHLAAVAETRDAAAAEALGAYATAAASALEQNAGTPPSAERIAEAFAPFAATADGTERVLVDDTGRVYASTDADFARAVDWAVAVRRSDGGRTSDADVGTARYRVAAAPIGATGLAVATAARADAPHGAGDAARALLWAFVLWSGLVGALAVRAYADGPRTAARLAAFAEQVARGDADAGAVRAAGRDLGTLAGAFAPVLTRLRADDRDRAEQRDHVAALYQVTPHYLVLCSLDGRLVEANPAFYAATGVPPEAVRDGRIEALARVFPVEPLLDLARRSLAEGAAIGGVDYGIVGDDEQPRPVEVSLKAFHAGGEDLVLIQATDVAARRRLQTRVEAFTDTLELMVDQRVAQLTAGQQSLRRILDAAGVVVASFDASGATRRWSGGARALTGREAAEVTHFVSAAAALGLSDADRAVFSAWFWNPGDAPHLGRHVLPRADGTLRTLQVVWHKVDADVPGRADARTLVGAPVPAEAAPRPFAGDGLAGEVPSPA